MKEVQYLKKKKWINKPKNMHNPLRWYSDYDVYLNNSYPYLNLLEEICSRISTNKKTNQSQLDRNLFKSEAKDFQYPFMDSSIYPFASLLQNFLCEEELYKLRDVSKDLVQRDNISLIMKSIPCSFKGTPDYNSNMDTFDFSYALRLKRMAYQSEQCNHGNEASSYFNCSTSNIKGINFSLEKVFPTLEEKETKDMTYSNRLRKISEQLKEEEKDSVKLEDFGLDETSLEIDCEESFSPPISPLLQPNCVNLNESCDEKKLKSKHSSNQNVYSNSECDKAQEEKRLFDALMENIKWQSVMNNSNRQNDSLLRESGPNQLGDVGITVIERRITHNLCNKDVR